MAIAALPTYLPATRNDFPVPPCHRVNVSPRHAWPRHACRSDPSRFFGDRINLVLQEHELGLHGRDFPGELFVLGDELLEEGDDAFVMLVSFHVSECGCVRKNIRRRHAYVGRRRLTPGGEGRRPIGQFL